jgi:sulfate adenylyltransferase subunit 2
VLLFSGGKDSAVVLRLAVKAFYPARLPFPVMHVDTGHNFPEVIEFRDRTDRRTRSAELIVASVQEAIDAGRVVEETGPRASRNRLQTESLLTAIEKNQFDAVFGGARRDEEKARAKERVFSFRDDSASGTRRTSAPSCGASTTPAPQGRACPGVPHLELDRDGHLPVHPRRGDRPPVGLLLHTRARCSSATAC